MLTNVDLTLREVLPGRGRRRRSILEATFQLLPEYVDISKHNPVLQTLSGPAVLLVWLYVMANVIVLGAEVNWWRGHRAAADRLRRATADRRLRRAQRVAPARPAAVRVRAFQSSPSSATVFVSPLGTKTGSKPKPPLPVASRAISPSRTPLPRTSRPSGASSTSSAT